MNKTSIRNQSIQFSPKKLRTQQSDNKRHGKAKISVKNSANNSKSKQGPNFQLLIHKSQNLNHDYFYTHRNNEEQLGLKSGEFRDMSPNEDMELLSNHYSEQEGLSEEEMEELQTIKMLSAKLHELESNFLLISSHYSQKICSLKQQLHVKNKQSQNLSQVLESLQKQQKVTQDEVSLLMKAIYESSAKVDNTIIQHDKKQHRKTINSGNILPLMSKKSRKDEQQLGRQSRGLKRSQVLLKMSSDRKKERKSRVLKSQQMLYRLNNNKVLDRENPEGILVNFNLKRA